MHSYGDILRIIEERTQIVEYIVLPVAHFFSCFGRYGFDAANTRCNAAFAHDAEQADAARTADVATAAKLYALVKLNYAHAVAVLFTKERNSAHLLCLFYRHIAVILQRNIFTYAAVNDALYLAQLFRRHFLVVRKVEAQISRCHE